jgi:hypothetical protein
MIHPGSPLIVDVLKRLAVEKTVRAQKRQRPQLGGRCLEDIHREDFPVRPYPDRASTRLAADA